MPTASSVKSAARAALKGRWPSAFCIGAILLSVFSVHLVLYESFLVMFSSVINITASNILALIILILAGQFFGMPLIYGSLRWFWFTSDGHNVPISEIFCYFSSSFEYLRALSLSFRIFLRIVAILVLCFLPTAIVTVIRQPITYQLLHYPMPDWVPSIWILNDFLAIFGTIISVILLMRYFTAPILMINCPDLAPQEVLHLSVIISKNANGKTINFLLSFILWAVLTLLVIPALYTVPFFLCAYAVYCRHIISNYNNIIAHDNNAFSPQYPNYIQK